MIEPDSFRFLFEQAQRIGEANAEQAIHNANEAKLLRRTIWRALGQLRAGRPDLARITLEQRVMKDQ
jgi:hypothetical protein